MSWPVRGGQLAPAALGEFGHGFGEPFACSRVEMNGEVDRQMLIDEGMITESDGKIVLTEKGKPLADTVALELIG